MEVPKKKSGRKKKKAFGLWFSTKFGRILHLLTAKRVKTAKGVKTKKRVKIKFVNILKRKTKKNGEVINSIEGIKWEKPEQGIMKGNADGSVKKSKLLGGHFKSAWGFVWRNEVGQVVGFGYGQLNGVSEKISILSEMKGLEKCIEFARGRYPRIILETDSLVACNLLQNEDCWRNIEYQIPKLINHPLLGIVLNTEEGYFDVGDDLLSELQEICNITTKDSGYVNFTTYSYVIADLVSLNDDLWQLLREFINHIFEIKNEMGVQNIEIVWNYREANFVADALASKGHNVVEVIATGGIKDLPRKVAVKAKKDAKGKVYRRGEK